MFVLRTVFGSIIFLTVACHGPAQEQHTPEMVPTKPSKLESAETRAVPVIVQYHVWYDTSYGVESQVFPTSERTDDAHRNYIWSMWDLRDFITEAGTLSPENIKSDGWRRHATTTKEGYPLVGLYDPDDPEILRWHIRLAKAAGITAFAVSLYDWENSKAEQRLREIFDNMLDIAAAENFFLAWEVWWCGEPDFFDRHKDILKHPAFYRIENNPVIWIAPSESPNDSFGNSTTEFSQNLAILETTLGYDVVWIVQNGNTENIDLLQVSGHTLIVLTGHDIDSNVSGYIDHVQNIHNQGLEAGAFVQPGFDDSGPRPQEPRYESRNGGQRLIDRLSAATQINADYVAAISWNDFGESTAIEPGLKEDLFSEPHKRDYYKDLRIISDFTGATFVVPALPPELSIDPLVRAKVSQTARFVGKAGLKEGAEDSTGVLFSLIGQYYGEDVVLVEELADDTMVDFDEDIAEVYGADTVLKIKSSANGDDSYDWAHWVQAEIHMGGLKKLDLIDLAPNAEWVSSTGPLTFPASGADGSVHYDTDVTMIDGEIYAQTLFTHPDWSANGFVQGTFSSLNITCDDNGFCCPGMEDIEPCPLCATKTRVCSLAGSWGDFGECTGAGVCEPGDAEQEDCEHGKIRERTCSNTCQWFEWGACEGGICQENEICRDHIDNNCNGQIDEGCEPAGIDTAVENGCGCASSNDAHGLWLVVLFLFGLSCNFRRSTERAYNRS